MAFLPSAIAPSGVVSLFSHRRRAVRDNASKLAATHRPTPPARKNLNDHHAKTHAKTLAKTLAKTHAKTCCLT